MLANEPKAWTRDQFEAFVMLVAAAGDLKMDIEEKRPIIDKVGEDWNDLLNLFRSLNDAERISIIFEGKDTHLKTEADREQLLSEVKAVFLADEEYADIERGIMSMLRKII